MYTIKIKFLKIKASVLYEELLYHQCIHLQVYGLHFHLRLFLIVNLASVFKVIESIWQVDGFEEMTCFILNV
jgi:hypothetical protein